jgi:ribulose-phosphate 3-epimerase
MVEIIPAIIPKSFSDLEGKLSFFSGLAPYVQIDVLDGRLTAEKSWPMIKDPDPDFSRIVHEDDGLPFWEKLNFEVDLMTLEPDALFENWARAGASRIIVHYESFPSPEIAKNAISKLSDDYSNKDSLVNMEIGLGLNIETSLSVLDDLKEYIDFVQFMGIAHIGFQGEPFDESVLEKIENLKAKWGDIIISVDGGVNEESAPRLVEAGANRLVVGSALLKSDNINESYNFFKNL